MENTMSMCRVCEEKSNLINISITNNNFYIDKFVNCANVTYQIGDGLPPFLCNHCVQRLDNAFAFKQQCETTHNKLIKLFMTNAKTDYATNHSNVNRFKAEFIEDESIIKQEDDYESIGYQDNNDFPQINEIEIETIDKIIVNQKRKKDTHPKHNVKHRASLNDPNNTVHWFYCDICDQKYRVRDRLEEHLRRNHKMKRNRYQCPQCQKWFIDRLYDRHLAVHQQQHICKICSKSFPNAHNLRRHIRVMHETTRKTCEYGCPLTGKFQSCMHLNQLHFKCDQCGIRYKTQSNLNQHQLSHLPEDQRPKKKQRVLEPKSKNFQAICQYCGKLSKTRSAEIAHLRTHTGEKPYECKICGNRFQTSLTYRNHSFLHTGEKPYKCETCGMNFRQQTHLITHRRVHTGEKPYTCQYCNKGFALKGNLVPHIRLHTGETPFKCEHCEKGFMDLNGLKRHRKKMHEVVA